MQCKTSDRRGTERMGAQVLAVLQLWQPLGSLLLHQILRLLLLLLLSRSGVVYCRN